MNFQQFASNNVLRNLKAYFGYFLSSTLSVAIFFSFTMFMYHPSLKKEGFTASIRTSIFTIEIIAYVFLLLFVFYSVSVFLKSRYNEFGILFMLGMSKKQLNKMIFIENLIISGLSVVMGIIFGLVFSKFFLLCTSKLLKINGLTFYFPIRALFVTATSFLLFFITISFLTSFVIRESQVLRLIKGTKQPKKEPKTSIVFVLLCAAFLTIGYFKAITATDENLEAVILPVTLMVIVATYLFFSQFTVFMIKILKKNRKIYMKKTNVLWISNLFYRVKDNARMFFIVTIASTVTFTSIGAVYTYHMNIKIETKNRFPQEIFYSSKGNIEKQNHIVNIIENSLNEEKVNYTKISGKIKVYKNTEGESFNLIKESDYNKIALSLNLKRLSLKENETFKVPGVTYTYKNRKNIDISKPISIKDKKLKVSELGEKNILPSSYYTNIYAIKDNFFDKIDDYILKEQFYTYGTKEWEGVFSATKNIRRQIDFQQDETNRVLISAPEVYELNRQSSGLLMFLALFIGFIFLFTTGSFLYNKFYMDGLEDKKKYKNMSKLGLTYGEIKKVVTIEIGILFLIPYIVAIIHSSFALSALKSAFDMEVVKSAFVVMGSFLIVQIAYFAIIKARYLREIKKEIEGYK